MRKLTQILKSLLWHLGILESHDVRVLDFFATQASRSNNSLHDSGNFHGMSQADEVGIIASILSRTNFDQPGRFLEFGVGDGSENNSLHFLLKGWQVWWFGNEKLMLEIPEGFSRLQYSQGWITKSNILEKSLELRNFRPDIVSMDLDGNDYHFTKLLLEMNIKPAIWVQEYNANFGSDIDWVMPYNDSHQWDLSTYWGASLSSFVKLFNEFGYSLVCCNLTGVNAFFVSNEYLQHFPEAQLTTIENYRPYRPWFLKSKQKVSPKILLGAN
jgi:hypothetical protein